MDDISNFILPAPDSMTQLPSSLRLSSLPCNPLLVTTLSPALSASKYFFSFFCFCNPGRIKKNTSQRITEVEATFEIHLP